MLRVYVAQKERDSHERSKEESENEGLSDDNEETDIDVVSEVEKGDETQKASDRSELHIIKDYCELTKFNPE